MLRIRFAWLILLLGLLGLFPITQPVSAQKIALAVRPVAGKVAAPVDDKKALESMNLSETDAPALIQYFKNRTLSDAELANLKAVIQRLGDENFEKRIQASQELEKFGPGAIGVLRTASQTNPDPEIAYRAKETLGKIEKIPHAQVASAAARALVNLKPANATATLLAFLPSSDNKLVEQDLRAALETLAIQDNKLNPDLLAGLNDPLPVRRSASVSALLSATLENKSLSADAIQAVKTILKDEKDPETKFEATYLLATKHNDRESISTMIDLIPEVSHGRLWQIEDFLLQIAGSDAPKTKMGPSRSDLEKARDEWKKWWQTNRDQRDLSKFVYKPTTMGNLLLLSADQQGYGNALVSEYGPDLRFRWRFAGVYCPADIQPIGEDKLLIMEQNYSRITERDTKGNIINTFQSNNYGQPFGFQRQADGTTLVAFQRTVVQYDKEWKETGKKYISQNFDLVDVQQSGKGPIFILARDQNRSLGKILKLDENWKEQPNPVSTTSLGYYQARMQVLPDERVIVVEQSRIAEYDLKGGKKDPVWTHTARNPSSAERLPNGNTLIVEQTISKISEVTPKGEVIWSQDTLDSRIPVRAIRR